MRTRATQALYPPTTLTHSGAAVYGSAIAEIVLVASVFGERGAS